MRADTPPALVEGVRADDYQRSLDPFVALATAAPVTTQLRLGTGVVLAAQHDPIVLAKQVATLDHLSGGRVVLGIGFGWNRAEAADHGVDFADRRRGRPGARPVHAGAVARRPGRVPRRVRRPRPLLDAGPSRSSGPACPSCSAGRPPPANFAAIAEYGDGWMPIGGSGLGEALPRAPPGLRGRPDGTRTGSGWCPFGTIPTDAKLEHFAGLGIDEVVLRVPGGDRPSRCWPSSTPTPPSSSGSGATVAEADDAGPPAPGPPGRPVERRRTRGAGRRRAPADGADRHLGPAARACWPRRPPQVEALSDALERAVPDDVPSRCPGSPRYDVGAEEPRRASSTRCRSTWWPVRATRWPRPIELVVRPAGGPGPGRVLAAPTRAPRAGSTVPRWPPPSTSSSPRPTCVADAAGPTVELTIRYRRPTLIGVESLFEAG